MKISLLKNCYAYIIIALMNACTQPDKPLQLHKIEGMVQGSYYAISFYASDTIGIKNSIDSLFKAIDLSLSIYNKNSTISRINRNEAFGHDPMFVEVFKRSLAVAEKTNGAFDPTVGQLVNAWGFGFKRKIPLDAEKVAELLKHTGFRKIKLFDNNILKEDMAIELDFNAIAQGYTADKVGELLEKRGITNYLIDIGGEVLGKGKKANGEAWKVGIEKPSADSISERELQLIIRLDNKAIATSGSYRKYYIENGIRYSHTIDPATGYPVKHRLLSVSVLADNCTDADAYATAFMVFGKDSALRFINSHPELKLEACFIYTENDSTLKTFSTKGLQAITEN